MLLCLVELFYLSSRYCSRANGQNNERERGAWHEIYRSACCLNWRYDILLGVVEV